MNVCAVAECGQAARKRGWCEKHYSRWKVHGTPTAPGRREQASACSMSGCTEKPTALDLCKRHYYAEARRRERAARPPKPVTVPPDCAIEGCGALAKTRGWCGAHYQRWRRFGDPAFAPPESRKSCRIEGCDGVTNARELCGRHYYRWKRYGDPLAGKNRPRVSEPIRQHPPRACVTCDQMFDPGPSIVRKYCGRQCRPSRSSVGVNKRATVERLARIHGWFCYLCFDPIDAGLYWPNTKAGSVDHVLAVVKGGTDDLDNLGLACLGCNLAKGTT